MKRQQGFTLIEALLIILTVSVVSFAGYYVWQNQQDKDNHAQNKASKSNSVNLHDKPKTKEAIQSSDKEQVIKKVASLCTDDADRKAAEAFLLDGSKGIVKIEGSFAYVSAGCESRGSSFASYLQKKNGDWTVILSGQEAPRCMDFDSIGIPSSILSECYDEATSDMRAPRP